MAPGLTLHIDIKKDSEVARHFERAGDAARSAAVGVFHGVGAEIVSRARAAIPAKRAAQAISYRVYDGKRNKGVGKVQLLVNTFNRRFRWVQQFEEGTVGTYDEDAVHGAVDMGVRPHNRRYSRRDVFQVIGRTRRKLVATGFVRVKAYSHKFHMPMRPFMRPAAAPVLSTVPGRLEKAIGSALAFEEGH